MKRLFAIGCLLSVLGWGQAPDYTATDGYTPASILPGTAQGSYALSGFDHVNLMNGQLSVSLPLLTIQGRGTVQVAITPNLQPPMWQAAYPGPNIYVKSTSWLINTLGFRYGTGRMVFRASGDSCNTGNPGATGGTNAWYNALTRGTYIAPDGTETQFVDVRSYGQKQPGTSAYARGVDWITTDGSFTKFTSANPITDPTDCTSTQQPASGTMITRDGTTYTIAGGYVTTIRDRNGNLTTFGPNGITDSLGRTYTVSSGYDSTTSRNFDQIQYAGSGGAARVITIWYGGFQSALIGSETQQTYGQLWFPGVDPNGNGNLSQPFGTRVVTEIDLADQSKYLFRYHSYGDIAEITLPTGGVVQYDYQTLEDNNHWGIMSRQLSERREYLHAGDSTPNAITVYPPPSQAGTYEIKRLDGARTMQSREVHTIGTDLGNQPSGTGYNFWQDGLESQVSYYGPDGTTLLRSIQKTWVQQPCGSCWFDPQTLTSPPWNPKLTKEVTAMDSLSKSTTYSYDSYNNVTDVYDYDWTTGTPGTLGALLRHTNTTYNYGLAGPLNILGQVQETKVWDGSNSLVTDTQYAYDQFAVETNGVSGTTHDNANFGGNQARSNLTTISRCLNVTSCTWLATTMTYDITGNVRTSTDANSHTTTYSYNDDGANQFAFITSTRNALNQTTKAFYDYSLGKLTDSYDLNGNHTHYIFGDALGRLTEAQFPDGGNTYYSYPDPNTVVRQQDQITTGDKALQWKTVYDGFGRLAEEDEFEDASHYIATTTTYDALGRVGTVSNPYRSTGDATYGTTTYLYDALGRVKSATTSDGAITGTSYSANQTTVTDPSGRARTTTSDALGRITSVTEDPGVSPHLNFVTQYSYNPVGNLTMVNQSGQVRTFSYYSPGWLWKSTNPESGTITYVYDSAGNLFTRTDNRQVTTTYGYDALNRIKSQSYTDGTPAVSYTYDTATNGVGRLASVSNANSVTTYGSYDALGRVWSSSQITSGVAYPFSYTYNLAGSVSTETYPSGRVVGITPDAAGRPNAVTGTWQGQTTNYVTQILYAPHGAVASYSYSNNVVPAWTYNSRLQASAQWATLGNDANKFLELRTWDWTWDTTPAHNNGTLQAATEGTGAGVPQSGLMTLNQSYTYDGLNRLQTVTDSGYSRSFGYL